MTLGVYKTFGANPMVEKIDVHVDVPPIKVDIPFQPKEAAPDFDALMDKVISKLLMIGSRLSVVEMKMDALEEKRREAMEPPKIIVNVEPTPVTISSPTLTVPDNKIEVHPPAVFVAPHPITAAWPLWLAALAPSVYLLINYLVHALNPAQH